MFFFCKKALLRMRHLFLSRRRLLQKYILFFKDFGNFDDFGNFVTNVVITGEILLSEKNFSRTEMSRLINTNALWRTYDTFIVVWETIYSRIYIYLSRTLEILKIRKNCKIWNVEKSYNFEKSQKPKYYLKSMNLIKKSTNMTNHQ